MENSRSLPPNRGLLAVRLSVTLGLAALLLAALLWASAGRTPTAASPAVAQAALVPHAGNVITIGVAAALSPPADSIGWRQANAVQLAISQTNAAGGVNVGGITYTLALVAADSACDPTQAITAAQTLLDAGVVAVVGDTCSGASSNAQPIYNAAGVPMVSPSSTWVGLTQQGYTTTFRVIGTDHAALILMARGFYQWLGFEEAAVVEWDGMQWTSDVFSTTFTGLGGTLSLGGSVTGRHTVTSTDAFTAVLAAIQPDNPDVVFYADLDPAHAALLTRVAHNMGLNVIGWFAGEEVAALDAYVTGAGPAAAGDYAGQNRRDPRDMPGYPDFSAAYEAAGFPNYGDADAWAAFAYDAAGVIIAALDRAASADPAAIRDEIAATANYKGAVGTYIGFDAQGDVIPQWAWLAQFRDGQWAKFYPYHMHLPIMLR